MDTNKKENLSFNLLELDLIINGQSIKVIRYFCFVEKKLYHINCPKQSYMRINGEKKNLPPKIYMVQDKMQTAHPIHRQIEKYFNI